MFLSPEDFEREDGWKGRFEKFELGERDFEKWELDFESSVFGKLGAGEIGSLEFGLMGFGLGHLESDLIFLR